MERLAYFDGGRWLVKIGDMEHSGPVADRLAAYEDAMPLERVQELAQAKKDGRLVVLPCNIHQPLYMGGDTTAGGQSNLPCG